MNLRHRARCWVYGGKKDKKVPTLRSTRWKRRLTLFNNHTRNILYFLNYSQHTLHFHEFQFEITFAWHGHPLKLWCLFLSFLTSETSETNTPFPLFPFLHVVKETWKSASCLCFSENFLKITFMPFSVLKVPCTPYFLNSPLPQCLGLQTDFSLLLQFFW